MRQHAGGAEVQRAGCGALAFLAASSANNQVKVAAKGGIELVFGAISQHLGHGGVQGAGCGTWES